MTWWSSCITINHEKLRSRCMYCNDTRKRRVPCHLCKQKGFVIYYKSEYVVHILCPECNGQTMLIVPCYCQ